MAELPEALRRWLYTVMFLISLFKLQASTYFSTVADKVCDRIAWYHGAWLVKWQRDEVGKANKGRK
ncbi:hypothetical protein CFP56_008995, partial [Quercus suber]